MRPLKRWREYWSLHNVIAYYQNVYCSHKRTWLPCSHRLMWLSEPKLRVTLWTQQWSVFTPCFSGWAMLWSTAGIRPTAQEKVLWQSRWVIDKVGQGQWWGIIDVNDTQGGLARGVGECGGCERVKERKNEMWAAERDSSTLERGEQVKGRERGNRDDEEGEGRDTEVLGVVMYVGLSESGRGRCSVLLTLGKQHPHPLNDTHTYLASVLHPPTTSPQVGLDTAAD